MTNFRYGDIGWTIISYCQKWFRSLYRRWIFVDSRNKAHNYRKEVIRRKGGRIITKEIMNEIREYARERFGSKSYWPWLALYTEVKGQFIKGWMPYDYYKLVFLPGINTKPALYLNDFKTYDYRLFGEFSIRPLFLFISGIYYTTDLEIFDYDDLMKFVSIYDNLIVIKEEGGRGGKQIRIINSSQFKPTLLNPKKNYVIQPYIKQYKALMDLYPNSVNTFRVTTYLNRKGTIDIKFVMLRFGIDGNKVDNLSSGGGYLFFDLNGNPDTYSYDIFGFPIGDRHKNTGYIYSNIRIPQFQEMLFKCVEAHKKFPYSKLIGWDVSIDHEGIPRLIEWNSDEPYFLGVEINSGPLWPYDEQF